MARKRQQLGEQEQVLERLLQGHSAAEIEADLGLLPGSVADMRRSEDFRAALNVRRAMRDLGRMDRLAALAAKALGVLEKALDAADPDPKLALAILQMAERLPPAVYPGEGQGTLENMERNASGWRPPISW